MSETTIITPEQLPAIIPDKMDAERLEVERKAQAAANEKKRADDEVARAAREKQEREDYEAKCKSDADAAAKVRAENENLKALEAAQREADQRVQAEKDAAAQRETDRLVGIAAEAATERKRAENKKHREGVNIDAHSALYECCEFEIRRDGTTRLVANAILDHIIAGKIPYVSIKY